MFEKSWSTRGVMLSVSGLNALNEIRVHMRMLVFDVTLTVVFPVSLEAFPGNGTLARGNRA